MRLIDADQLKELILKERDAIPKTISERYGFGIGRPNNHGNSMRGGIRKALRCMEQCTTIEAEPVKHGRWESLGCDEFFCSECYSHYEYESSKCDYNYCPNCGAKMDGGAENE